MVKHNFKTTSNGLRKKLYDKENINYLNIFK